MSTLSDERDPVDVVAEEFADRLRRGERPSVSDYAAKHPEHADQIRQVLPAVAQMEQLKRFRRSASVSAEEHLPDRLGDFRIVRELGRGGMGVVFEAVQESLGRRVALKVLAAHAQLHPERRERFIREAKAAAGLHHTNIVPVFGVGEQDGLPYYVMQLIPGHGLNALISRWKDLSKRDTRAVAALGDTTVISKGSALNDLPRHPEPEVPRPSIGPVAGDWNLIASIGQQVAQALFYAHQKGVLHRDVKPANLLLDDRNEVWVVDFGLAKLANDERLTTTGHIVGTLQYLAPECLHGTSDARSDVYGLGATMYELLTLSAPVEGDSPVQIMKRIAESTPVPPRKLNPHIPRDLETIVLKAMSRDPARRYASARLLAEDLQAFLEDRPIRARRESAPERAWRWARQHPAVAALSCCTVAALALAAALGWSGYVKTKAALESEAKKRDEAEAASAKLKANLALSLEAFEKVFLAAAGDELRPGPRPPGGPGGPPPGGPLYKDAADKAAVLEAMLDFYDKFAVENATEAPLRFEVAKAYRRVGEMHQWMNRQDKAKSAFLRSNELLTGLQKEWANDTDVKFERLLLYSSAIIDPEGLDVQFQRASELADGFTTAPRKWSAGAVYLKLGWHREQARRWAEAESSYRKAIALLAREPDGPNPPPNFVVDHVSARTRLAAVLAERKAYPEARQILEGAANELRSMAVGGPQSRFLRDHLAGVLNQLADVHQRQGDEAAAARLRNDARRLMDGFGGGPFPKGPPKKG